MKPSCRVTAVASCEWLVDVDVTQAERCRRSECTFRNQNGHAEQCRWSHTSVNKRVTQFCPGLNKWHISVFFMKMRANSFGPAAPRACWGSSAGLSHRLLSHAVFFACWQDFLRCSLLVKHRPHGLSSLDSSCSETAHKIAVFTGKSTYLCVFLYWGVGRMGNASIVWFGTRDRESCAWEAGEADRTAGTGNFFSLIKLRDLLKHP